MDLTERSPGVIQRVPEQTQQMIVDIINFFGAKQIGEIIIIKQNLTFTFAFVDMQVQGFGLIFREMPADFRFSG
jgi:hypothetical protein